MSPLYLWHILILLTDPHLETKPVPVSHYSYTLHVLFQTISNGILFLLIFILLLALVLLPLPQVIQVSVCLCLLLLTPPPACIVPGQLLGILPSRLSTEMSIPFTHGTVYVVSVRYANNIAFLEKGRQLPSLMLPAKHYNIISISNSAKNCVVFALLVLSDVPC